MSAQPPAGKKGKKKAKGTTVSLTDFLQDSSPTPVIKNIDWADESEDLDGADSSTYMSSYNNKQLLSSLPTGPRASRTIEVDVSKLPDEPPFTAFVGNLPYEADEMMLKEFFKELKVISVRLPEENGRFKGYGYVEFEDKHSLYNALQQNDETFNKRQIRVDVAGSKNQDRGGSRNRNYGGYGGFNFDDGPDLTESDWRKKPDDDSGPQQSERDRGFRNDNSFSRDERGQDDSSRGYNRDRGYGGDRDRGYGGDRDRGYGGERDRGYGGNRDQGFGGYRDRGYGGDRDRGYGGDRDRGYGGDRDRGYGGDRNRGYGGDRDRGYGGDRDRGYGGDRDRGYGGDRDRGYGGDRDRGYGSSRDFGSGRSYGGSDRGYGGGSSSYGGNDRGYGERGGDRYRSGQNEDVGYGRDSSRNTDYHSGADDRRQNSGERDRQYSADTAETVERPRLQLIPRTKPIEAEKSTETWRSSIFGNAKPVDTASREKQIEEKLKQGTERHGKDERRDWPRRTSRRSSERSDDGQYHPSSPRRSQKSQSSDQDDEPHRRRSTSPGHRPDSDSKGSSHSDYKPAPTPKANPWNKKSPSSGEQSSSGERKVQPRTSTSEDESHTKKPDMRPAPAPSTNSWSRGPPKVETRGEREEAEGGDSREDDMSERTPEGADDQDLHRRSVDVGDGSEQGKVNSGPGNRTVNNSRGYTEQKQRRHGDGQRDDAMGRGPRQQQSYDNRYDYQDGGRRRGDGGSGRRGEPAWNTDHGSDGRGHGKNEGQYSRDRDNRDRKYNDGRDRDNVDHTRNEPVRTKSGQDKRRDSSRDSRPECDRSAAAGQEQDFRSGHKGGKGARPRGPPELEPKPVTEFVQKSKFSALTIEDDDDENDSPDLPLEADVISPDKVDG